ncbi:MAG: nucleotide exchange factor GrpE [Flavobacteriales bacterium]
MALKNPFRRSVKEHPAMDDKTVKNEASEHAAAMNEAQEPATADTPSAGDNSELEVLKAELDLLRAEHQAIHDKHVRLFAEFDNFRKRTAKERLDLLQYAGENTLKAVLPVLDDMDRAIANNAKVDDIEAIREGFNLIHQKMVHALGSQGLKAMPDAKGEPFDTDRHEAITKAPAPTPELKGKVIDVVENGYTLHDKVIRYAKVVVGE